MLSDATIELGVAELLFAASVIVLLVSLSYARRDGWRWRMLRSELERPPPAHSVWNRAYRAGMHEAFRQVNLQYDRAARKRDARGHHCDYRVRLEAARQALRDRAHPENEERDK